MRARMLRFMRGQPGKIGAGMRLIEMVSSILAGVSHVRKKGVAYGFASLYKSYKIETKSRL
ncbi:hypothetical protein GCM10007981_14020 [Thermocladium modestius]|uniref:Uncharacterized protein n=1 Tax=Thermocladium modestius TaxID=62609 RepID=A0A830GUK1_9CREN|nr:hypothetical protein GCM10007981_14020 [Thermocladium modestius]